jgi:hypothetical protein
MEFQKKQMFLKIGTSATQGVASQYQLGNKFGLPFLFNLFAQVMSEASFKESISEWKRMSETIC